MSVVHDQQLQHILDGCRQKQRASQHRLYALFYNYAMTVAQRYAGSLETAEEVVNDAFFKVFTKIHLYGGDQPFRQWFRRIVINTSIDRYRSNLSTQPVAELQPWHEPLADDGVLERLTQEQILGMLNQLPPAYRTVFNLFVVDGYSHEEIADLLEISPGASKSNLSRARQHLKTILSTDFEFSRKK